MNFASLIKAHLRGGNCRVFNSDLKVHIFNTSNYAYPGLSVTCDERDREHALYITYPCLVVDYRAGDRVELKSIDLSLPIEQFYEEVVFEQPLNRTDVS